MSMRTPCPRTTGPAAGSTPAGAWCRGGLLCVCLLALSLGGPPAQARGCAAAQARPGATRTGCLEAGGRRRGYRIHVPVAHGKGRLALILGVHGGGDSPRRFEAYSGLSRLSDAGGDFVVVYPLGVDGHWNDGRPGVNAGVDDLGFLRSLVSQLEADPGLRLDPGRVFAAGMSNGGLMALRLACERPGWLSGVAVVAAAMSTELARDCAGGPVPILFLFGSEDPAFLADGRLVSPVAPSQLRGHHIGIEASVRHWTRRNGCRAEAGRPGLIDRLHREDDHTRVWVHRYRGCRKPVVWYRIEGGGHRWPDPEARNGPLRVRVLGLGRASHEISAAELLWAVFQGR